MQKDLIKPHIQKPILRPLVLTLPQPTNTEPANPGADAPEEKCVLGLSFNFSNIFSWLQRALFRTLQHRIKYVLPKKNDFSCFSWWIC